ncbi:hypothetical protein FOZ61_006201 [Perkinsus olseni]|nr:hypothetical protein FOZ61_006201 [Perkinsus olseni]
MKPRWYNCNGRCPIKCNPWVYWILTAISAAICIVAIIFAILVKTTYEDQYTNGVDAMRFIDNTYQTTDCSNMFVGDATCPGLAYQAWLMNSTEARETCLSSSSPSNAAVAASSGWCDASKDGCVKPDMCLRGMPYDFYAFNVTNPAEILKNGAKPVVQELRPVHAAQTSERIEASVDVDKWNNEGIAHWNETNTFVFADKDETALLQQKVIVPNLALLSTITEMGHTVSTMEMLQMLGTCGTYQELAKTVTGMMKLAPAMVSNLIKAQFGSIEAAIQSQYFDAGLTRMLDDGEINMQALGTKLAPLAGGLDVSSMLPPSSMAIDYFAYAFGCVAKQDANHSCKFNPDSQADVDLEKKINGTFSETSKNKIFNFMMNTNFTDTTGAVVAMKVLEMTLKPSEIEAWHDQLNYAGSYGLSNYDTMRHTLFPYTDPSSKSYDADYEFYPRFIKMSVAQLLGWDNEAFTDKFSGQAVSMGVAKPVINGAPTEQYRSSKIPDWKGLDYFKMYNGQTQNCAFDRDCMAQDSFKKDGTCTANDVCTPNYVAGWDAKFFPGTLNGKGTDEYHKKDALARLFVGQIFSAATLKNIEVDADWDGAKVDKWTLSDIDFRNENCDGSNPHDSQGIDCDSPYLSFNLGYFASPDPASVMVPVYASLPHFDIVNGSSSRSQNYYPGDRVNILSCSGDPNCEGDRDFRINVWTEPISGAFVNGQEKLQMNVRFPPTANGKTGEMTQDCLIPSFWLNKHQKAFPFQLDTMKVEQAAPGMFNGLMGGLIAIAIIFFIAALIIGWLGWERRKQIKYGEKEVASKCSIEQGDSQSSEAEPEAPANTGA